MPARAIRRAERSAKAREVGVALREAGDIFASPERLTAIAERWAHHPAVAETLAKNTSAPPQALGVLLMRVPFAVAKNPVLVLAPLEDPEFLLRASPYALGRFLMRPEAPLSLIMLLAAHPDPVIAEAAAGHVTLAGEATYEDFKSFFKALPPGDLELRTTLVAAGALERRWLPRGTVVSPSTEAPPIGQALAQEGTQLQLLALRSLRVDPDEYIGASSPYVRMGALLNPRLGRSALSTRAIDSHRLVRALAQARLTNLEFRF
ncbi:MAG: hypothetical protein QM758_24785 [Armatimonas sp.]